MIFLSLGLQSCRPEYTIPDLGLNYENLGKVAILYSATHVNDKTSFIENSSITIAHDGSFPFFSGGVTTYSSTIKTDPAHYITITINNPHVQVYTETSPDIDIKYCNGTPFYRIVPTRPFTLEITRWDSRAVGTFSGILEHRFDNASTVSITDGSFDILIQ